MQVSTSVTSKPDTIKVGEEYSMIFDLWNVPPGPHVVEFVNTTQAPEYFTMKRIGVDQYVYVGANDVKDSLNAYAMIGYRQLYRGALTAALAWTDTILALNDSSITGWNLRGAVYEGQKDTTNAIDAFSRVISIINYNHDPAINLADSVATYEERTWKVDERSRAAFRRYRLVTGSNFIAR